MARGNNYLSKLKSMKKLAKRKKQERAKSGDGLIDLDVSCHGMISDAFINKDGLIELVLNGYQDSTKSFEIRKTFNPNSPSVRYYNEICKTLGTRRKPHELIGKYIEFHLEENDSFENLKIDREESEEILVDYLSCIEDIEEDSDDSTDDDEYDSKKAVLKKKKKRKVKPIVDVEDDIVDDLSDFD